MLRPAWPFAAPVAAMCLALARAGGGEAPADAAAAKFFETKIRPVLVARCHECHGPESKQEGNLRVDSRAALVKGGDLGPAIKPGDPQASLLVSAINHGELVQMPPKTKLPAEEIADLTAWVAGGAPWPDDAATGHTPAPSLAALDVTDEDRQFWAFQPPRAQSLPAVKDARWPTSPLDHFVLAALETRGLRPAPPADKRKLIRRATFDLHGLPPTPEEVENFLADNANEAFARVIDRLLASPRYGERWGRRWLDIARYADSNGMDENMAMAHAWRYRDWVVAAFNRDMAYDEFLEQQLAGDLLPTADDATNFERLVATGFLVLGPKMLAEDDPVKMEMDIIDEQIDTIGRAVMGLSLGCARCHDHKFDPIPTTDYYALAGIFKSTKTMENYRVVAMWSERLLGTADQIARLKKSDQEIARGAADIKKTQKEANEGVLAEARGNAGAYLLASAARDRQERELAALSVELAKGPTPDGATLLEAEKYDRGNVVRDLATYGAGIGVIYNAGLLPNVAEYDVDLPAAGTYQIALRYAAAEARPLALSLDGRLLKPDAASGVTGSWTPDSQTWSIEAVVPLAVGRHVIRLERNEPFPHVDKLALVQARFAQEQAGGEWRAVGQRTEHGKLKAAIVDLWSEYLARAKQDPKSVFRLWHTWLEAGEPAAALLADADPGLAAMLLRAPRPKTLGDLATRYEQLFNEAALASKATPKASAGATAPLTDQALDRFRQVLADSAGLLKRPGGIEAAYSQEARSKLKALRDESAELEKSRPVLPRAIAVDEREPCNVRVHLRGSHLTLGDEVPRRFPRVLAGNHQAPISAHASGRLELARWLTQPDHPLTGRVMANRIWQGHFGEGLVRTSDNFGRLGERPDNQPLLDWLAVRFVESGWSIKAMHRLIMSSSAYQLSTAYDERAAAADPENRLLWRMNRRRLEAEEVRDAILAAAGRLEDTMGGTLLTNQNHTYVTSTASTNNVNYENARRSIYLPVVRSAVYEVFSAFDFADPSTMIGRRPSTTVAPQALFMMNSALVLEQTRATAEHLLSRDDFDEAGRVDIAYQRAYSRAASAEETSRALQFVADYRADLVGKGMETNEARVRAWQALCRVILSSNEFIYLE